MKDCLKGVRVLSLALNLPGPGALLRCRDMGADCVKLEPPAPAGAASADPMQIYSPRAYAVLHEGIRVLQANLKTAEGQQILHDELAQADVLITSFRRSALKKLGLDWTALHERYPRLGMVVIVGASGDRADEAGHDLTYQAESGLITGLDLPPTLFADMGGALLATEAILQARLNQLQKGEGVCLEVALADAACYLALPRDWGMIAPDSLTGGGHPGYAVYPCRDGRVALAALEPHFMLALVRAMGDTEAVSVAIAGLSRAHIAEFLATKTRSELDAIAREWDVPLYTMP